MQNLISPIFLQLPQFEQVVFKGFVEGAKVQKFSARREGVECDVLSLSFIRKDEAILWEASIDLLKRGLQDAQPLVRGIYRMDLLHFDVQEDTLSFSHKNFSQLIINHAKEMGVGECRGIKYCSSYWILHKIRAEEFPKIEFKSAVEFFDKAPEKFDLLVKKFVNLLPLGEDPVIAVIADLSNTPVFDSADIPQQERLQKMLAKILPGGQPRPELFVSSRDGFISLAKFA